MYVRRSSALSPAYRTRRWRLFRKHTYFATFVMALAGTAAADPKSPQCWDCLQRLAMGLPADNTQEDPSYEQGLTPGPVSGITLHSCLM
jgi:hypothetical protein